MELRYLVRLLVPVAAALGAACGGDKTGPRSAVTREDLNGFFVCNQALGWVSGRPPAESYFRAGCAGYTTLTNPDRTDSGETFPFTVTPTNEVRRDDFTGQGTVRFDPSTSTMQIEFPGRPVETYVAAFSGGVLALIRQVPAFDYTGDGQTDSLELYFIKSTEPGSPGR